MRPLADEHVRKRLVERAMPMVTGLARSLAKSWPRTNREELVSTGYVALVECTRAYDPSTGTPFEAFARKRVRGAMIELVVRDVYGGNATLQRILSYDARDEPPVPSAEELMQEALTPAPSTVEPRAEALALLRQKCGVLSFVAAEQNLASGSASTPLELALRKEAVERVSAAVAELGPEEREFFAKFYDQDATLDEAAAEMRISKRTVSRIHQRLKDVVSRALQRDGYLDKSAAVP